MEEKEYYNREELDKIMYSYIRETAEELKIDLWKKNSGNKEVQYV